MFSSKDLLGKFRQSRRRQSYSRQVAVSQLLPVDLNSVSQSYLFMWLRRGSTLGGRGQLPRPKPRSCPPPNMTWNIFFEELKG